MDKLPPNDGSKVLISPATWTIAACRIPQCAEEPEKYNDDLPRVRYRFCFTHRRESEQYHAIQVAIWHDYQQFRPYRNPHWRYEGYEHMVGAI